VVQEFDQLHGHDLPGHAVAVFQPATLPGFLVAARGKMVPAVIHFLSRVAVDDERNRLVELEDRAAVQRGEI